MNSDTPVKLTTKAVKEAANLRESVLGELQALDRGREAGPCLPLLLVVAACDAFGGALFDTKYGGGDAGARFFRDYLLPEEWKGAAPSLFAVLREGIAGAFESRTIVELGPRPIEVVVAWKDGAHHDDRSIRWDPIRSTIVINVEDLLASLKRALDAVIEAVRASPELQRRFVRARRRRRTHEVTAKGELKAWSAVLDSARTTSLQIDPKGTGADA